jgi:exonuclease SbcD
MRLIHLSDLHIGKRVNDFSMLDDQKYILEQILRIIDAQEPNGVLIAGDVYDKSVPSAEATVLLDSFLVELANRKIQTFIIGGNHDSQERLSFASRLIDASGIHISSAYKGKINPFVLTDEHGDVNIYLLPFIKPVMVKKEKDEIFSYTEAVKMVVEEMELDTSKRNVLVSHQLVTGAERSDSEEISIGGTDNIDASVLMDFDYVALGHLHRPQSCGESKIRYCGTPLKYSFSEAGDKKSVTVVDIEKKGEVKISTVPLVPLHDMVELRGSYNELTKMDFYKDTTYQTDYVHITLTDEDDVPDAIGKLRIIYKNLMKLDYDNERTRKNLEIEGALSVEDKTPLELFEELYLRQNNKEMTQEQRDFVKELIEKIWEGEE